MTETPISAGQFLACLKQQVPVSSQIKAANQLDASSLSENEQKQIADALRTFAGTKNGPMLIMGLPGPLQALLSFSGAVMPGQDRLAYLRATPRQALVRLAHHDDRRLLESYPFDKASKADWSCYLSKATKLIEPCKKFLHRAESAGGFSDAELCDIVERNTRILGYVPISRISPDSALKLLSSDSASYIRANYNFKRFEKTHWSKLLESGSVTSIHDDCVPYLENKDGQGFSNTELIALARKCPLVSSWIDPDNTPFSDAYRLYTENHADALWKKYPFSSLKKDEWLVILRNSKIAIPSVFSTAVNYGMFSVSELLDLAGHNNRIYPFIPLDKIDQISLVSHLLKNEAAFLWQHYDFRRLNALSWERLICERRATSIVPHAALLFSAKGLSNLIVGRILEHDDRYINYVPLSLVSKEKQISLLVTGKYDDFWNKCDFSEFEKADWWLLFSKTDKVPPAFKVAVEKKLFSLSELCDYARHNEGFVPYLPIADIDAKTLVDLLVCSKTDYLWTSANLKRLNADQWVELIKKRKPLIPGKFLQHLRNAKQLGTRHVTRILDVDYRYYTYVPLELIPCDRIVKYLLSGEAEDLWQTYPFDLFKDDDWFALLEQSDHPVPDAGMVFLANQFGAVSVDKLNLLLAKRRTLVGYMRPQDIDPKLAVGFLTQSSDSPLWKSYDFNRFSDSQIQTIVRKSADRDSWPEAIVAKFSDGEGSFSDEIILSLAEGLSHTDGDITNVVELLSVSRIHKSGVRFFARICKRIPQVKSASATVIRKLTLGDKPWLRLNQEFLVVLLIDVPICRKFINWQDYELVTIDKLASANHVYEDELRAGRKFKLFVWRHWLALTIFLVVVSCIACVTAKALYDAAKERAMAERKNNIAFRINELGRRSEFHQLQQYVDTVEKGEDADVLQQNNVANALNRLSDWNAKRDSLDTALRRLESLSAANWPEDNLEEANRIFAQLKANDSAESDESALIKKFHSGYSSRVAEVERVKRNERLAAEIAKITDDCVGCSSVESLIGMFVELTRISEVVDISEKNKSSCSKAIALAKARINDLYKETLTLQRGVIDQAKAESEVVDAWGVVLPIESTTCASEENIREVEIIRNLANKKIAEIRAAEAARLAAEKEKREKQEVETISLKVTSLVSQLDAPCDSFDDNLFIKIREELDLLSECPSYGRFCKENPREIPALSSRLEAYEKGIAKADELGRKCIDIEGDAASRMLGGKERELCDDLIRQLDSWIGDYASTIAWKIKSIESHKSKIANLLEESNTVKTLIDNANGATDYKTLCESINALLEKHSGFAECQEIDPAKILSEKQVMSVIEDSGFFSTKRLFEFAGLIKINPKSKGAIVPLLNNSVTNATFIYYVTRMSDSEDGKNGLKVKKIFERTANGVVRRVNGIDYSRCQGVGLFVSTDPTYVDQDSWIPGMTHTAYPHWMASSTYGEWVPEPGYGKTSSAGEGLGNLEWCPSKTYLKGTARSGNFQGEWQKKVRCSLCFGSGKVMRKKETWCCRRCDGTGRLQQRRKCEKCSLCNWSGYRWITFECPDCWGKGVSYKYDRVKCTQCRGDGCVWENVRGTKEAREILRQIMSEMLKEGK